VLSVGVSETKDTYRILVRDVFLAVDQVDYVPGTHGYRALTAKFVAEKSDYCAENNLGYLAVHCHSGKDSVQFSGDDIASHNRGYSALLDITSGPVGALVFAENAVAGKIWTKDGVFDLDSLKIISSKMMTLYPDNSKIRVKVASRVYDRHARLFGDLGQQIFSTLTVGIIGSGGGGSLLNEWLSKLGVGKIISVDFDKIETSNLPRVVDANSLDAQTRLSESRHLVLKRLGRFLSRYKVHIARRVAKKANPSIRYEAIVGDVLVEKTALRLKNADFIFLASDTIASRNVFNALLHQFLIPGAQIGSKVRVDPKTKEIIDIFAVGRLILPHDGCLFCNGWIPPGRLQEESVSDEQRKRQRYVEDDSVAEPSVITLNVLSAAQAINDFMMMFAGLYPMDKKLPSVYYDVLNRQIELMATRKREDCLHCGRIKKSMFAKGDRGILPCK
jgi:tRNA A37 threonylcarbamoyladenosine dehydratase